MTARVWFIRHGETAWSRSGQHTSRTDLPLTDAGEQEVIGLRELVRVRRFARVLASPATRARRTCELVGLSPQAEVDPDLAEWDYGSYEGRRTVDILAERPRWNLFDDGCPDGESPAAVSERCDRLIAHLRAIDGDIAVFSHGYLGRALAVRWIGLPISHGRRLELGTASLSVLARDGGVAAIGTIERWNLPGPGGPAVPAADGMVIHP